MPKISTAQRAVRRQQILDAALEVFGDKGYTVASIDDIVKASGISKGGIYTYFESKESILLAIAHQRFEARHQMLREGEAKRSVIEQLERYMYWLLTAMDEPTFVKNTRFTFEFWSVMSRMAETSVIALERYQLFEADLVALLERGIQAGEIRQDLAVKSAVLHLLSGLDGMCFMRTVMGVPVTEEAISEFVKLYISYWRRS